MKKVILILTVMAVSLFARIDINTASAKELASIKGIGDKKAAAIVKYRQANGKFKSYNDLEKVKGIGPALILNIKNDVKDGEKTAKNSRKKTSNKSTNSKTSTKKSDTKKAKSAKKSKASKTKLDKSTKSTKKSKASKTKSDKKLKATKKSGAKKSKATKKSSSKKKKTSNKDKK